VSGQIYGIMRSGHALGKAGEDFAAAYLLAQGYRILERNYRFGRIEVDIIARDGQFIVFVEVKARSSIRYGYPEAAIDRKKVNRIARVAAHYMYEKGIEAFMRFDVVALERKGTEWICAHTPDAFFPES
jgi:putative endonuclease